ncbi:hypothetical protein GCM10025857_24240 [Alicyclobacillus contaminans]|nr:hypothetical protein GCM10025857_24240 [Alicyclobacillus contaminans]
MKKRTRRFIALLVVACGMVTVAELAVFSHYESLLGEASRFPHRRRKPYSP